MNDFYLYFFYVSSLISFTTIQLQMPCPELAAPMFGLALHMGHPNLAVIMVHLFRWVVDQEATPCVHVEAADKVLNFFFFFLLKSATLNYRCCWMKSVLWDLVSSSCSSHPSSTSP